MRGVRRQARATSVPQRREQQVEDQGSFPHAPQPSDKWYCRTGPLTLVPTGPLSMAKRTASFNLLLPARETKTPACRWLYTALRAEVLAGRLRPGSRVPATRDLARQYGLSRGTVVNAFEELKSEGYLHGSRGSGTYVSSVLPEHLLQVAQKPAQELSVRKQPRRLS